MDAKKIDSLLGVLRERNIVELEIDEDERRLRMRRGVGRTFPESRVIDVKSPLVGVFHRADANGRPPHVRVGDRVERHSVLCSIEVLSVPYVLRAFTRGTVIEILPEDGEPVEYGEILFRIGLE